MEQSQSTEYVVSVRLPSLHKNSSIISEANSGIDTSDWMRYELSLSVVISDETEIVEAAYWCGYEVRLGKTTETEEAMVIRST